MPSSTYMYFNMLFFFFIIIFCINLSLCKKYSWVHIFHPQLILLRLVSPFWWIFRLYQRKYENNSIKICYDQKTIRQNDSIYWQLFTYRVVCHFGINVIFSKPYKDPNESRNVLKMCTVIIYKVFAKWK
jgi:type IV secretory pathway VirB3-like protein